MNAGRRQWIEKVAPDWTARAARLRDFSGEGPRRRAEAIDSIVRSLLAELNDTEPPQRAAAPPITRHVATSPPCQFEFTV